MKTTRILVLALAIGHSTVGALAQEHRHSSANAPYSGYETRAIKSLSDEDIEEIRRGGGWGLALPAELNGKPGPAHVLELKDELDLSEDQLTAIDAIYRSMKAEAIAAGERFIAAEAALSAAFEDDDLDEATLRALIRETETARAELRFVHLSRHLSTTPLLTGEQIRRYAILRGYAADPCESVPDGHDPAMWRRHNNC